MTIEEASPPLRKTDLPRELQRKVQGELRPGERLVWTAQPQPDLYARLPVAVVAFFIIWTAIAVLWVAVASLFTLFGPPAPPPLNLFPIFGVPFVLIGVGMLTVPGYWLRGMARSTIYVITDQRAILFLARASGAMNVLSFDPQRLASMTRDERADGNGDLIFEWFQEPYGSGTRTVRRGFMSVERVREVEELIVATLLRGRTRQT